MRIIVCLIVCTLGWPAKAVAQFVTDIPTPPSIRQAIRSADFDNIALTRTAVPAFQTTGGRERSFGRKIAGGAIGGVGGFFGGGYLGDGECDCDDPGFKGFLIGAPIGAVVGAILGVKLF